MASVKYKSNTEKLKLIEDDLKAQLRSAGKTGNYFDDLIKDYIFYVDQKDILQHDLNTKGLRYRVKTGNGFSTSKPNESYKNIFSTTACMLKILQDLGLQKPTEPNGNGDEPDDIC